MSEFMESHAVAKLIGSPPGYVGFDDGGQLTEKIRRRPYSVVLLDEVEKAHADVFNIFLQIFDDGRLTDSRGRVVNFKNTIFVMTSNVGAKLIQEDVEKKGKVSKEIENKVLENLSQVFRPEFLNRIDEIVLFASLSKDEIEKIVDLQLEKVSKKLEKQKIKINFSDEVREHIAKKGYVPEFGARPLKRVIQKEILDKLALKMIEGKINKKIEVKIEKGEIVQIFTLQ